MSKYVKLFNKNNVNIGGSAYLQSKCYNAKVEIMSKHLDFENQWYIDNKIDPETLKSTETEEEKKIREEKIQTSKEEEESMKNKEGS